MKTETWTRSEKIKSQGESDMIGRDTRTYRETENPAQRHTYTHGERQIEREKEREREKTSEKENTP